MSDADRTRPSKTRAKREALALRELAGRLAALTTRQQRRIPMNDDLRDAFDALAGFDSHGARRRQLQRIGRLLRECDPDDARAMADALDTLHEPDARARARQHEAERLRDALLDDPAPARARFAERCPGADLARLDELVRSAADSVRDRRALYRFVHAALQPD